MEFGFKQPLVGEKRCVTTLTTTLSPRSRSLGCDVALCVIQLCRSIDRGYFARSKGGIFSGKNIKTSALVKNPF